MAQVRVYRNHRAPSLRWLVLVEAEGIALLRMHVSSACQPHPPSTEPQVAGAGGGGRHSTTARKEMLVLVVAEAAERVDRNHRAPSLPGDFSGIFLPSKNVYSVA